MKTSISLALFILLFIIKGLTPAMAQNTGDSPQAWSIVATYTIPGKASGLASDGYYIYFGIYGSNGNEIYKFDPANGISTLQCTGAFGDAYGLTYKSPNLVTIDQPSSSTPPANALEFNMSGSTVATFPLPNHYMSGIAWDNGTWWVCTYYPDPGKVYHLDVSGAVLSEFIPPQNQPWDICTQDGNLWIADYNAFMLYKVSPTGTLLESHASAGQRPAGVVYDGTYLWYCDGPLGGNSTLYKVNLSGAGTPVINVPVTTHNYGAVTIGNSSTWNCQVQNTGTANLTITNIEIPPDQPISTSFVAPQTIAPGGSLNVPLTYTPVTSAALNTLVSIHSSDPIHPLTNLTLTGTAVYNGAHVLIAENSHDYGTRRAGAYSRWDLTVTNDGSQNLVITGLPITDDHFIIDASITLPLTIASQASKEIGIWFHPAEGISYEGQLSIVSNASGQGAVTIDLEGDGTEVGYPIGTQLWTYNITGASDNSPKCIVPIDDITGDGVDDVIVGSEDYKIRCFNGNSSVTADVLWTKEIYSGSVYQQNSISIIDDINGDGYRDVIVGTAWGDRSIIALSGKTGVQLWKHDTHEYGDGGWVYQVDTRYDYNQDGDPDVLAATGDDSNDIGPTRVYCLNGETGISIWERDLGGAVFSVIGVEDFTGDSQPDVVAGATNQQETQGRVVGINGATGAQVWTYTTVGSSVWGLMQLDDINNDGIKDIAAGDFSGFVLFFNAATGVKIGQTSVGPVLILRLQDMGDVNNNGFRDVLVSHSGINAVIIDGKTCTAIWTKPLADKSWCVANTGDVNWDGTNDAAVGTLFQSNFTYFLNGKNGSVLHSGPSAAAVDALNAIPDIVGDNSMELLYGNRDGLLTCLSGGYDTNTFVGFRQAENLTFTVFPNPTKGIFNAQLLSYDGNMAGFRLFDTQGRMVAQFPDQPLLSGTNRITFNVKGIAPGIYFLEVTCANEQKTVKLVIRD